VTIKSISDQFLLFSGLLVLWSFVSYGMSADPLPDGGTFDWKMWRRVLVLRIIVAAGISYLIGHSIVVSGWLATFAAAQPWIRFRSRQQWTGELEVLITAVNLGFIFLLIRHLHLRLHTYIEVQVSREHISATCIVIAILFFVVRGGTYIVRGFLRKTDTLPLIKTEPGSVADVREKPMSPSASTSSVDTVEINRGRLIGNLERLLLMIVVAAGSYAALGFLVAAKGLVRSKELEEREFAEYFLASVYEITSQISAAI
jgi:hypothetical protein